MFAVVCPYCTFRNERGARFCADCGAPLHLKPCAKCSKVDDVMVRQCLGCGTAFPQIELYDPETGESIGAPPPVDEEAPPTPPPVKTVRHTYGAGPLIAVALVAGALPTLWMNRHLFPQPKAWQTTPVKPLAPVEPSITAPVAPPPTVPATVQSAPVAAAPAEAVPQPAPAPVEAVPKPKERKSGSRQSEKKRIGDAAEAKEATDASAEAPGSAARPCTESLVALGLCDKSQIQK
jgi:hypothetical protein